MADTCPECECLYPEHSQNCPTLRPKIDPLKDLQERVARLEKIVSMLVEMKGQGFCV